MVTIATDVKHQNCWKNIGLVLWVGKGTGLLFITLQLASDHKTLASSETIYICRSDMA